MKKTYCLALMLLFLAIGTAYAQDSQQKRIDSLRLELSNCPEYSLLCRIKNVPAMAV